MPRAEAGSAKAVGNAMKAKGLTKLRFYCQICQKACRDENGYKCHIESESHMRQIAALGNNSAKVIDNFSKEFQDGFVSLLSRRFGTARINANKVYQEYIQERHHLHMNATRWVSLSEFVKHLGRQGICKVEEITDEGQFGWYVSWIDTSPAALARQDALQKMGRAKVDEEGRMRKQLSQQIERAKEARYSEDDDPARRKIEEGLRRDEGGAPLTLKISDKPGSRKSQDGEAKVSFGGPSKVGNPFKSSVSTKNVFKSTRMGGNTSSRPGHSAVSPSVLSSKATPTEEAGRTHVKPASMTAAERIKAEEEALREKRRSMGPQPSAKRLRM